jgi:hypothetical protein
MRMQYGLPYPNLTELADLQPTLNMLSIELWDYILPVLEKLLVTHDDTPYHLFFQRLESALQYEISEDEYGNLGYLAARGYFMNYDAVRQQLTGPWSDIERIYLEYRHTELFTRRWAQIHSLELHPDLTLVCVDTEEVVSDVWNYQHRGHHVRMAI